MPELKVIADHGLTTLRKSSSSQVQPRSTLATVAVATQKLTRGFSGPQNMIVSMYVVSSACCCIGERHPLVTGPTRNSLSWRPPSETFSDPSSESCHAISKRIGCRHVLKIIFFKSRGANPSMTALLQRPLCHQSASSWHMSVFVLKMDSFQICQLKSSCRGFSASQTLQKDFQPARQFSCRRSVVSIDRSHAEQSRNIISRRSVLIPVMDA